MLFSKTKNEEGFIIIPAIIVLGLFAALELNLFYSLNNLQKLNTAKNFSVKEESELARRILISKVNKTTKTSLGVSKEFTTEKNSKSIELFYKNKSSSRSPSFEHLESLPKADCSVDEKNELLSIFSCSKIEDEALKNKAFSIQGNLISKEKLEINSEILFVKGEIKAKGPLEINGANIPLDKEVIIIALGDIEIGNLKIKGTLKKLTLYSQSGEIKIQNLDQSFTLCSEENLEDETKGKTQDTNYTKLSLFSFLEKKAANTISSNPGNLGCPITFSGKIWPKEVLIAKKNT